jgi:hypothetical protein
MKYRLITFITILTICIVLFGIRYQNRSATALEALVKMGVRVESRGPKGLYMEIPDLIDPEHAIEYLSEIQKIDHIHFVSGESPPTGEAYLRTWAWDDREASRRIALFKNALPNTKFTFWPGAF